MIEPTKAITLYQPWASLLACGAKKYETRSWATNYRGPIAIHAAAKKCDWRELPREAHYVMVQAIRPITDKLSPTIGYVPFDLLPYGAVIATAELVGCWRITASDGKRACMLHLPNGNPCVSGNELLFGDWTPGRYAWEFANMTMLPEPIPARGQQRLWNWEGIA